MSRHLTGAAAALAGLGAVVLGAVACAACCVPLFGGPVLAILAGSGLGLAAISQFGLVLVLMAAVALYAGFRLRQRQANAAQVCACAPDAGCNAGDMCTLPPPATRQDRGRAIAP